MVTCTGHIGIHEGADGRTYVVNLRSGPFLASLICSFMSSLAKIGPDQKSLKNSVWSAKFWPTKLVI